jgi:tripartite-type tricarboxylate transporter receptor subunit TctC
VARLIAGQVSEDGKQSVIVETRVGAGSVVGSAQVARSAPDSLLRTDLPYETMSMQPLCMLVESTQVLVINAALSYGTFNDFIDDARRRPNELKLCFLRACDFAAHRWRDPEAASRDQHCLRFLPGGVRQRLMRCWEII